MTLGTVPIQVLHYYYYYYYYYYDTAETVSDDKDDGNELISQANIETLVLPMLNWIIMMMIMNSNSDENDDNGEHDDDDIMSKQAVQTIAQRIYWYCKVLNRVITIMMIMNSNRGLETTIREMTLTTSTKEKMIMTMASQTDCRAGLCKWEYYILFCLIVVHKILPFRKFGLP